MKIETKTKEHLQSKNRNVDAEKQAKGITLIALVITIIVLLILAGVTIAMLTGQNGILTNATNANSSSVYYGAEEQVKLCYMSVRTQIMTETVANSSYDATDTTTDSNGKSNVDKLADIVKKDLNAVDGTSHTKDFGVEIEEDYNSTGKPAIKIVYKNSKIYQDTIATGKPSKNGEVEYYITLAKQSAGLVADEVEVANVADAGSGSGSGSGKTIASGTYTAGQEVVLNGTKYEVVTAENKDSGEHFFVLEDQGSTVKLLARYCLNQAGTEQVNAGYSTYGRGFSKTNYWLSTIGSSSEYDLQTSAMITAATADGDVEEGIQNAVKTAMKYGEAKGVEGRLIKFEEAYSILNGSNDTLKNILRGNWTDAASRPTQGYLDWWIGTASSGGTVYNVRGEYEWFVQSDDDYGVNYDWTYYGVRPILIVPES